MTRRISNATHIASLVTNDVDCITQLGLLVSRVRGKADKQLENKLHYEKTI